MRLGRGAMWRSEGGMGAGQRAASVEELRVRVSAEGGVHIYSTLGASQPSIGYDGLNCAAIQFGLKRAKFEMWNPK